MTASAARAASFGNPDQPPQGAIPGPRNKAIGDQFPSAQSPPAIDVGDMPMNWASFNNAPTKGKARMTVFNTGAKAMTMDFNPGEKKN
jgi:oxalate decarboxylase